jgi:putative tricarboxylic transport membrane protein
MTNRMGRATLAALATTAMFAGAPAMAEWAPERPVEFIASGAGGGTDNFARTIQAAFSKHGIIDRSMVVLNKGGGSGSEGFLYAKANKGDPHKLIFGTNNVYLLPHVANMPYAADDLIPIQAMALDEFLIWVKVDSPYQTATDLVEAAKANPGQIAFAGSQTKDTDETVVALLEQATGADFKYVPFNGGGEVGIQLAGGHVAANTNNPNENLGQWQAGAVRPLCVFSPERMAESEPIHDGKGWHDIPTCAEQGIPVDSFRMPRTVWVPADTPPEAIAFYQTALQKVTETPEWQDYLTRTSQTAAYMSGNDLAAFITDDEAKNVKVYGAEGWLVQ